MASCLGTTTANAQRPGNNFRVSEIRVEGSQRIEAETVRSYMSFRRGDIVSAAALDKSLKSLFVTGLFADVILRREGHAVVVRVVENPIINRIVFEGNKRISDEILNDEVRLRSRVVFTRARVQQDVQRIIQIYRRSGRFAAKIEPKVIQLPQNRVDLVYEINEGELTEIKKIAFIGNSKISDSKLQSVIQTKETAWYRYFSASDTYDPDRLTFDRELLRRHYLAGGYADFRVVSAVAELSPDKSGFYITFTVEEGERYKFGKVDISTALRDLNETEVRKHVKIAENDWYDANLVQDTVSALADAAGSFGYAFVDVRPRVKRLRDKKLINIVFNIQEGPRVFVERINITGNVRTQDKVIRREFRLIEGDAFSTAKLRRSRQRIRNLGFFEKVEVANVPGTTPDSTVVNVEVQEKSTGEVSFGAGFSSSSGVLGDLTLRERNLIGKGQDIKLRLSLGQREQQIDLSFTEPYFLNRNLSAGFDIFRNTRDLQQESSFDRERLGGKLRIGYRIKEALIQNWFVGGREDTVTDIDEGASLAIQEQEGPAVTISVGHGLSYDVRNSRFNTSRGYLLRMDNEFAGFAGDVEYFKNELSGSYYYPFLADVVGSVSAGSGYIVGLGNGIRIVDRFFLGGGDLRGFDNLGVGPRDVVTGDAVGGNWYYRGSLQVRFPLGLPNELGFQGRIFTDIGSLGGTDGGTGVVTDTGSLRAAAGAGIGWDSPFGPISVDISRAFLKESFDDDQTVRFSFGTRF
ncbi:MAG: outer membrane protein assembly factor BamA [Pseudomonadota bacterium]|nr:outer membrane protein assembly factor BamA [Pseudomonadota bacterium]